MLDLDLNWGYYIPNTSKGHPTLWQTFEKQLGTND